MSIQSKLSGIFCSAAIGAPEEQRHERGRNDDKQRVQSWDRHNRLPLLSWKVNVILQSPTGRFGYRFLTQRYEHYVDEASRTLRIGSR